MSVHKHVERLEAPFKFVDLFSGIGGFHYALSKLGGKCVFASEIDLHACDTYEINHGIRPHGDITCIDEHTVPDHDVLTAGFPCQPFSHAGVKRGLTDVRGTLFFDTARVLEAKKPKFAILENVRGLISNDQGRTLLTIFQTLHDIGYKTIVPDDIILEGDIRGLQKYAKRMLMNSRFFGVPQNRVRIYIVAWRNDLNFTYTYPKQAEGTKTLSDVLDPANYIAEFTLSDKLWAGHQRRKKQNAVAGKGFGYRLFARADSYVNTISARYYKDGSDALIEQPGGRNPRKLTPREVARLQGFPEDFVLHPSKIQTYKQLGNSITIPVALGVARNLRDPSLLHTQHDHCSK